MDYLLERLKEPSTWRGLAVLATAAGVTFSPEQMEAIVPVGLAVAGVIGVLAPERKP
jgi:hypothetical protein